MRSGLGPTAGVMVRRAIAELGQPETCTDVAVLYLRMLEIASDRPALAPGIALDTDAAERARWYVERAEGAHLRIWRSRRKRPAQ